MLDAYYNDLQDLFALHQLGDNWLSQSSHLLLCVNIIFPVTAAGGYRSFQRRHAEGREAAAGGIQLHHPDRRLWTSWTTQEGLQTLQ